MRCGAIVVVVVVIVCIDSYFKAHYRLGKALEALSDVVEGLSNGTDESRLRLKSAADDALQLAKLLKKDRNRASKNGSSNGNNAANGRTDARWMMSENTRSKLDQYWKKVVNERGSIVGLHSMRVSNIIEFDCC